MNRDVKRQSSSLALQACCRAGAFPHLPAGRAHAESLPQDGGHPRGARAPTYAAQRLSQHHDPSLASVGEDHTVGKVAAQIAMVVVMFAKLADTDRPHRRRGLIPKAATGEYGRAGTRRSGRPRPARYARPVQLQALFVVSGEQCCLR